MKEQAETSGLPSVGDWSFFMIPTSDSIRTIRLGAVTIILGWLAMGRCNVEAQTITPAAVPPVVKTDPNPLAPDYAAAPLKEWEKGFSEFEFRTFAKDGRVLPYRFYRPAKLERGKAYPVVLFFHGKGQRGTDNRNQFKGLVWTRFWEKYPCFIVAPQCPWQSKEFDNRWVKISFSSSEHTMSAQPAREMQLAMDLLDKIMSDNPVDPDRVYVTGLSMGGFATWDILQREGEKFAAAIPVCGGADLAVASRLVDFPLWVFHGGADTSVLPQRSRAIVDAITKAGGHPKYTEYPGVGHQAWVPTYSNPEVWDWLFAQSKSKSKGAK